MNEIMIPNEPALRFGFFLGVFLLMAVWGILAPLRCRVASRKIRWTGNFGVVLISTLLVRFLIPTAAVGLAMIADERGWGLFHHLALSYWLVVFLSVLFLDFAIYRQHVLFHNSPWWDRLLGTYRAQPDAGHIGMTIGIEQFRVIRDLRLDRLLIQPFLGKTGRFPVNAREKTGWRKELDSIVYYRV